jgi:hypothetical protein
MDEGSMGTVSGRGVWVIRVLIEATADEARQAEESIACALCPDENHSGYCPVPWTTITVQLNDLDDDERAECQHSFDEQRQAARKTGEHGV